MRLKQLRITFNISQRNLASILGASQNTISQYERKIREPDNKTLIQIADYFEVSIDYLLERTNNPTFLKD